MKKLLLFLIIPFLGFSQSFERVKKDGWSLPSVRAYIDARISSDSPLKPLEGIYNYSSDNPNITSQYKFAIFYYPDEYVFKGHIMEARCVGCQNFRRGDVKLVLEESVMEGEFSYKWYQPGRRNKKGELKKSHYVSATGNAYEEFDYTQVGLDFRDGSKVQLLKIYPKLNN